MKLVGDVPKEHRDLAIKLRDVESKIDDMIHYVPEASRAKCYVAMAHDWYAMGADEEGAKLLIKAEKACPGYFKNQINEHTKESEEYAQLVNNITMELRGLLLTGFISDH